jgi:hypothetical protein
MSDAAYANSTAFSPENVWKQWEQIRAWKKERETCRVEHESAIRHVRLRALTKYG